MKLDNRLLDIKVKYTWDQIFMAYKIAKMRIKIRDYDYQYLVSLVDEILENEIDLINEDIKQKKGE